MVAPQPFFRARGTPFSVLHRIRALTSQGHRVVLVTYPFGEDVTMPGLTIVRCGKPPFVNDVKVGPSVAKLPLDLLLYRETVRQLKRHRFDVMHSHEEAAFFAARLAKRFGIPHIYDMHSSLPQQLGNFGRYNLLPIRKVFEHLERYVLDSCDGVITICPDLGELITRTCPQKPHSMIENTGDDQQVFPASGASARETHALGGKKVILYTGTFEAYQGLELLLEAFRSVAGEQPSAHLVMVGGNERQVSEMQRQVDAMQLADRVTLVGTVHPSRIPSYMAAADLIVSPRISGTNTPLKIYGYLRSGIPVLATDILSHTQILTPEVAHLVPPTAAGFEQGLRVLLRDPAYARTLAERAKQLADAMFSDHAYIEKVERFYRLLFPAPSELEQPSAAYAKS
jgi:glycosyltransferase involved in cell wall biosynthesis